jgi:hypothetical protein
LAERAHFIVKPRRAKAKGALEEHGIEVRSPMEVFQEEEGKEEEVDSY